MNLHWVVHVIMMSTIGLLYKRIFLVNIPLNNVYLPLNNAITSSSRDHWYLMWLPQSRKPLFSKIKSPSCCLHCHWIARNDTQGNIRAILLPATFIAWKLPENCPVWHCPFKRVLRKLPLVVFLTRGCSMSVNFVHSEWRVCTRGWSSHYSLSVVGRRRCRLKFKSWWSLL